MFGADHNTKKFLGVRADGSGTIRTSRTTRHLSAPRLATELWVQAQLRTCDLNAIPAVVRHRGDPELGAVILVHNRLAAGSTAFSRVTLESGDPGWLRATGETPVPDREVEAYIKRQIDRDPDTWVIEIEDRDGRFTLDAPIV